MWWQHWCFMARIYNVFLTNINISWNPDCNLCSKACNWIKYKCNWNDFFANDARGHRFIHPSEKMWSVPLFYHVYFTLAAWSDLADKIRIVLPYKILPTQGPLSRGASDALKFNTVCLFMHPSPFFFYYTLIMGTFGIKVLLFCIC